MSPALNKCVICGKQSSTVGKTLGEKQQKILRRWKADCARSLCDTLFNNSLSVTEVSAFLNYFQMGPYCPACQQMVRDIDFTRRQIKALYIQKNKLSGIACQLICCNYNQLSSKNAEELLDEKKKSSFNYNYSQTVNKMYSVFLKMGKSEINEGALNQDNIENMESEPVTFEIKKEVDFEDYGTNYDDDNWAPGNEDDFSDGDVYFGEDFNIVKPDIEEENGERSLRTTRTEQENEIEGERSFNRLKSERSGLSDRELRKLRRESLNIKKKKAKKVSKAYSEKYDPDWKGHFIKKSTPLVKKDVGELRKKTSRPRGGVPKGNIQHLVFDDSEMAIIRKYSVGKLRLNYARFTQAEEALFNKISDSQMSAVEELELGEEEKAFLWKIRSRFKSRVKLIKRTGAPKLELKICQEDNCDEVFPTEDELDGHIRGKHKGEKLPFLCTTCPRKFNKLANLKGHRSQRHKGAKLSYYHFCVICEKGYGTEEGLKEHSSGAHLGPNPFSCAFCDKELTNSLNLIQHMGSSHAEHPTEKIDRITQWKCDQCSKYCRSEKALRRHMVHGHKSQPKHQCNICNEIFPNQSKLQNHKNKHIGGFMCDICGKVLSSLHSLNGHSLVHSDVLQHSCKLCRKKFKRREQLLDHERVHAGIRSFICGSCGKGFMTNNIRICHEKTHEPGYVPRKPFRNKRPNKRKTIEEPSESTNTLNDQKIIEPPEGNLPIIHNPGAPPAYDVAEQERIYNNIILYPISNQIPYPNKYILNRGDDPSVN